jgi:negative regulator of flagellin synthesis FlgM
MRIDPNANISQAQDTGAVSSSTAGAGTGAKAAQAAAGTQSDQATLSSDAVRFSNLSSQLSNVPEIRQDRVAQVSQALQNGTYSVSNKQIAQSMLRDFPSGKP